jgi:hypothetical protein
MEHNHFQKQTTDKGWRSMSELLDQQMPVKQKRRRPAAWWWTAAAGALLPLAVAGAWWMTVLTQSDAKQSPDAPDANAQPPIVSEKPEYKPANRTQHTVPPSSTAQAQRTPVFSAKNATSAPHTTAVTPRSFSAKNVPNIPNVPALRFGDKLPAATQPSKPDNAESDLDTPEPAAISAAALTLTTLPTTFQLLENLTNTHNLLPSAPTKKTKPVAKPKKKEQHQKLRIGATLGVATERFTAANSALAGMTLDWQPSRRWGLRSGLMYEHYQPSGFARPIAEINADEYANATHNYAFLFNNGLYVPGTSQTLGLDVALPVTLMQRLRAPLLSYWQPAKFLRVYGGGSFSYTLLVHTSDKGLTSDSELVGARSPSSLSKVNKLATEELPRFQAQLQTGFGIRLGKRWEVEMAYRQSAKIQFQSLFEKRAEDGQPLQNTSNMARRPNHQFFTLGGSYFF